MILDNLVKFAFGATKAVINTASTVTPYIAKGVKASKDVLEAEVKNAITTYEDNTIDDEKETFGLVIDYSKEIMAQPNERLIKPKSLEIEIKQEDVKL